MLKQFYPGRPTFTEDSISSQLGKIHILTGANTGVGYELASCLYQHHSSVYLFCRSEEKTRDAIKRLQTAHPNSQGRLIYIHCDLADLSSVKKAAEEFTQKENQLHVLWNNAGLYMPGKDDVTAQGHDIQLGIMALSPFLLTSLLLPVLTATAAQPQTPSSTVRVIFTASIAVDVASKDLFKMDNLSAPIKGSLVDRYTIAKIGDLFLTAEFTERTRKSGIVVLSTNPGNLKSDFHRNVPRWQMPIYNRILYPPRYGAYTQLFAGLDNSITTEQSGSYIHPWGRVGTLRKDYQADIKRKEQGGTGLAGEFWEWCQEEVKGYL